MSTVYEYRKLIKQPKETVDAQRTKYENELLYRIDICSYFSVKLLLSSVNMYLLTPEVQRKIIDIIEINGWEKYYDICKFLLNRMRPTTRTLTYISNNYNYEILSELMEEPDDCISNVFRKFTSSCDIYENNYNNRDYKITLKTLDKILKAGLIHNPLYEIEEHIVDDLFMDYEYFDEDINHRCRKFYCDECENYFEKALLFLKRGNRALHTFYEKFEYSEDDNIIRLKHAILLSIKINEVKIPDNYPNALLLY